MPVFKMPTPIKRPTSDFYWIRKKVPENLRPLVGKTEIWASLGTKNPRQAMVKRRVSTSINSVSYEECRVSSRR